MTVERINLESLYNATQYGFSHASLQKGGATLHIAGQVAWDKDHKVVGNDLATQARQALSNLKAILASAGAGPADVVRMRTYVVNHDPSKLGPVTEELMVFFGGTTPAPNTWIGVQALALPEFLIEIEATAAVPS